MFLVGTWIDNVYKFENMLKGSISSNII